MGSVQRSSSSPAFELDSNTIAAQVGSRLVQAVDEQGLSLKGLNSAKRGKNEPSVLEARGRGQGGRGRGRGRGRARRNDTDDDKQ